MINIFSCLWGHIPSAKLLKPSSHEASHLAYFPRHWMSACEILVEILRYRLLAPISDRKTEAQRHLTNLPEVPHNIEPGSEFCALSAL